MAKKKSLTTKAMKIYRLTKKIGQPNAAKLLGCSQSHLSYICNGKRQPSEALVRAIDSLDTRDLAGEVDSRDSAGQVSFVRISKQLLSGPPFKELEFLDSTTLPVSHLIGTTSMYAIRVENAGTLPKPFENATLPTDFLLIETRFRKKEVRAGSLIVNSSPDLHLALNRQEPTIFDEATGKNLRGIDLPREQKSDSRGSSQARPAACGLVVRLIRELRAN